MPIVPVRLGLALVLAALGLGERTAHAQAAPVSYWTPGWPLGFGGNAFAGQGSNATGANTYGNFPGFDGAGDDGFSHARLDFSNGFFIDSKRGAVSGFSQDAAFGSLYAEGVQFGYRLQNTPLAIYGGFDTFKYNTGVGGSFAGFDSTSSTLPAYGAHVGVEFQATSNLSLSLGVGYTQTSGRIDSDTPSPSLSNTSQFDLVGGRR